MSKGWRVPVMRSIWGLQDWICSLFCCCGRECGVEVVPRAFLNESDWNHVVQSVPHSPLECIDLSPENPSIPSFSLLTNFSVKLFLASLFATHFPPSSPLCIRNLWNRTTKIWFLWHWNWRWINWGWANKEGTSSEGLQRKMLGNVLSRNFALSFLHAIARM